MRVGVSSVERDPQALRRRVLAAPRMVGADLSAEVTTPPTVHRRRAEGEHRFTVAALDLGIKRNVARRLAARGVTTHVLPSTSRRSTSCSRSAPDAVFFSPGPGDPATADHAGRAGPRGAAPADAAVRHLLRQPDPRPGARLRHLQAGLRPPRHQPAGARPDHRQGRGHLAQPRLRGGRPGRPAVDTPFGAVEVIHVCLNDDVVEGLRALRRAGVHRAVPPGGGGRPARRRLPVRPVRRADQRRQRPEGRPACHAGTISSTSW